MAAYYITSTSSKEECNGNLQITFAITAFYTIILHSFYRNITRVVLEYSIIGLLAALSGTAIGYWIFRKWNEILSRKL